MSAPSDIYLPRTLPYPITLIDVHVKPGDEVKRGTRLLSYSFRNALPGVSTASSSSQTSFGTWDAPVDGTITRWNVAKGDTLDKARAAARPAVVLDEPCKHGLQMGGLCAICGKDMTALDYTGYSDSARASIQMTHLAGGPTVSLEEARRLENETAERLLRARKLSLIVDLDQTIVHATVDPTVGEWIAEGEAWEARGDASSPAPNANWDALRDVHKFTLPHDGPAHYRNGEANGAMYYIKPRPGLMQFLEKISEKYEMHVYTMGTRTYAEKVCAAIDPHGRMFGKRILSRDESGSLTAKSLQRLFPCDTSMVVIIDDRSDVWDRSPNLVEVVRYDFFVGIGDINSTFLPPRVDPLLRIPPGAPTIERKPTGPQPAPEDEDTALEDALLSKQAEALEAQMEERPLAKKQHELEEQEGEQHEERPNGNGTVLLHPKPEERKTALLRNDDTELARLQHILTEVHERYFKLYEARRPHDDVRKAAVPYDVRTIITSIKAQTFAGMHFLFSSVIPLDVKPEESPIWRQAQEYGATCHSEVSPRLTHVITAKRSTAKVDAARRKGDAHIVWVQWFLDSTSVWHVQEETPYLVDAEADRKYRGREVSAPLSAAAREPTPPDSDEAMNGGFDEEELGTVDVDWDAINAEVEAAMNETDDDGDDGESELGTPRRSRSGTRSPRGVKRARSVDSNATTGSVRGKRSKLREEVTVGDNEDEPPDTQEAGDEDEEDDEDWDEDFLAQELS